MQVPSSNLSITENVSRESLEPPELEEQLAELLHGLSDDSVHDPDFIPFVENTLCSNEPQVNALLLLVKFNKNWKIYTM